MREKFDEFAKSPNSICQTVCNSISIISIVMFSPNVISPNTFLLNFFLPNFCPIRYFIISWEHIATCLQLSANLQVILSETDHLFGRQLVVILDGLLMAQSMPQALL